MYELIICEKPKAAQKIADSLADGKPIKKSVQKVPYYEITRGNRDIVVGCAVGHLYTLGEKDKKGWKYPVFDLEWKPTYEANKTAAFAKKYSTVLKKLAKGADSFVVATDYDVEGEVIGFNIIRFICKKKDAARMKFSTLTQPDLIKSYEGRSQHIDHNQAEAGETRHYMDWLYGVNLSRALTSAINSTGTFKVLSSGRVQGPALKIIVDREKEIKAFKPVLFWQIELKGEVNKNAIVAWHIEDKFWEKDKADKIVKKTKGKDGVVVKVEKTETKQMPPAPFDLTTLQTESYKCFGIAPKDTLSLAQELYTSGYISYPRTSSQVLPKEIGYANILSNLAKQKDYAELCKKLLAKKTLMPNNGTKTDPAHPAIYPTGIVPKLSDREKKIYDLIVKRFMATFSDYALRESVSVHIDIEKEIFVARGVTTKEKGWHVFYAPYVTYKEEELPPINEKDKVKNKGIEEQAKETQPPKRYTQASLIRELEKKELGTKATRAQIIDTLFQRGYVQGKAVEATDLGIRTVETLEKHCPKIVDVELTRHFEEEMEDIRDGKKKEKEVLDEVKDVLTDILADFKKKENGIGRGLAEANNETRAKASLIGKCPNCEEGNLVIKRGKFGRFAACDKYPDCKTTFNLPSNGLVKVSDKQCEHCQHPILTIIRKAKKPQDVCINPKCPSKQVNKSDIKEKPCPKCKEGKMVIRKSVYGAFMACNRYPKCRHTEKIENNNTK